MPTDHKNRRLSARRWIPAPRLYGGLAVIAAGAFGAAAAVNFFGQNFPLGLSSLLLLAFAVAALVDYLWSRQLGPVVVERQLPGSLAVNKQANVSLHLRHAFIRPTTIRVFDDLPAAAELHKLPLTLQLIPGQAARVNYTLRPLERGPLQIGRCHLQVSSPLGLWTVSYRSGPVSQLKVYPDFMAITAYTILATDNHTSQIGIKKKPRRGTGLEFQQLREYRRGDSLRQLDWKATARRQQLISREYQDERDQQIVLLIDSGRRMRTRDDDLSHFDHALNAVLLVSYIALRQGDSVSVMSFGENHRWLPPQKGTGRIKNLLNGMYDLQAENCAPDYTKAAEKLAVLQQKRSLVIIVTNSRDEDVSELLLAVNLLKRRHLVMIANLREEILDQLENTPVTHLDDAFAYAGVHNYLAMREDAQHRLTQAGVYTLECTAKTLAMKLANSYLEIKSARIL